MFKTALATATGPDAASLADCLARRALAQVPDPQIGILFAPTALDQKAFFETLRRALKGIPLYGMTSPFGISTRGVEPGAAVLCLLRTDDLQFHLYSGKTANNPAEVSRYLFSRYQFEHPPQDQDLVACLMSGTEIHGRGNEYLAGPRELLPRPLPITGGTVLGTYPSRDSNAINQGSMYCGNLVQQDMLNLLFLKEAGPAGRIGFGFANDSSWRPIAHPVTCTKADRNIVYEVDGQPIHQYLESFLGPDYQEVLNVNVARFTLMAHLREGPIEKSLIRAPVTFDRQAGSISFWPPEDLQGQEIQLAQMSRDDLLAGAAAAARRARAALGPLHPALVLAFSCATRYKILNTWAEREVNALREVFGPGVPIIGMYCGSEFAPLLDTAAEISDKRRTLAGSRQFGASVSLLVIGTPEPPDPARDLYKMLDGFRREDLERFPPTEAERTAHLVAQLEEADRAFVETERSLQVLIRQHYETTCALFRRNQELAEANRRSERLQSVIRQYTPHTVWDKASVTVMAGLYHIPDEETFSSFMFMDVKGFTTFAEKNPPDRVIAELNEIFRPATDLVYANGGDVDKYIGDCIFARFETSEGALRCALAVQEMLREKRTDGCPFAVRIGLHHGRIVSGNVGADQRRENALIGDAVNLTQRLEANCTPGCVLVSQAFLAQLDRALLQGLSTHEKTIQVKGKTEPVVVLEITPAGGPAA
ncbi:MAG: hypothetical protein GX442_12295 [Candidatus Riflebacteria bacterium]|nr:hypothetical protein [Candidatus Riflebacteria bacterium]